MAYALKLDPRINLAGEIPQPTRPAGGGLELIFYAGASGVNYRVLSSTDLIDWDEAGVTLSPLDAESMQTATVDAASGNILFLRLVVTEG